MDHAPSHLGVPMSMGVGNDIIQSSDSDSDQDNSPQSPKSKSRKASIELEKNNKQED